MSYSFDEILGVVEESRPIYGKDARSINFIVDAQLPKRLSDFLKRQGFDSIHTLDLPNKNATTDNFIKNKAHLEDLVLITKDDDFLHSFLIERKPPRLILIKTGNISNNELLDIFYQGLSSIISLIQIHPLIEITKEEIIVHD